MAMEPEAFLHAYADLTSEPRKLGSALPVVYSPSYNISFFGLESLHPFDPCKFRRVVAHLQRTKLLPHGAIPPAEATDSVLRDVHTTEYLNVLHSSPAKVAAVVELPPLRLLPMFLLQSLLLRKLRHHVAGTMLAVGLARQRGWAINVGGGMHHAYHADGDGWCPYADITLAIRRVRAASEGRVRRVMVVDTDAHQGNGVERDKAFFGDNDLFIVDLYNADVFPQDAHAAAAIDVGCRLRSGCGDTEYRSALQSALATAFARFQPDLVIHNAGTDVLVGDPLGRMRVSASMVAERDKLVWTRCRDAGVPVCMLLSGGYAKQSAAVIADSLAALLTLERDRAGGSVGKAGS